MGVGSQQLGDQDTARDLMDEAFARAWASWRTVSRHPAPKAWVVRTAPKTGSLLRGVDGPLALGLVYASPQCTG